MDPVAAAFLTIGALLLVSLVAETAGRLTIVPRVTTLLVLGFLAGPGGFDVLPSLTDQWFPIVTQLALVMIGFLIGAEFTLSALRDHGRATASIALVQVVVTAVMVGAALLVAGSEVELALPLAGIATATAPAATMAVIAELHARGPLTRMVTAVVAIDDVVSLALFSVLVAVAAALVGVDGTTSIVLESFWELLGGVLVGCVVGFPAAYLTGRLKPGEPTREEAFGIVLICAGLAIWLDVSFILAAVVMGALVANLAQHHERPFHEIENIEWPFLTVFFFLAGARLDVGHLSGLGVVGVVYLGSRVVGKILGARLGCRLVGDTPETGRRLGFALLPQAGVALGLSLQVAERFPTVADDVVAVVVLATMFFELIGPIAARWSLERAGEAGPAPLPP